MDERAIREFMNRRWQEVADARTAFWAGRFAQDREVSWRAAQALLDRAAHAFARR